MAHFPCSPCWFPLLPLLFPWLPFVPLSTYLAPSSCDRNRPPPSQVACKLTLFAPPFTQLSHPFQFPRTPTAQRPTTTTLGPFRSCYTEQLYIYNLEILYAHCVSINVQPLVGGGRRRLAHVIVLVLTQVRVLLRTCTDIITHTCRYNSFTQVLVDTHILYTGYAPYFYGSILLRNM